jgi:hypothetical protein
MPLDEQNQLLLAAGFAPRYDEAPLDDDGMSHVRDVVQLILRSHEPFPAFAVDPSWNILAANEAHYALSRLMIDDDTRRQIGGDNALRLLFHPQGVKNHITNWTDVSPYLVQAVRRKSALHPNARQLATLVAEIEDWSGRATVTRNQRDVPPGDFALPMTFRIGGQRISLVTTMLSFAAPFATAVESLTIETFYPADEQSRTALEALARKSPARQ